MRRQLSYVFAVIAVLTVSAFFVANVPLRPAMWPVSLIAILLFSAPVFIGCVGWLGVKRGMSLAALLGVYALIFETVAVKTGLPYGQFGYGALLGPHLFDSVPATVLVAWSPLVLGVMAMLPRMSAMKQVMSGTILLVTIDLVLDPAAVRLGFWQWDVPGFYYGVPLINFFGWLISGGIAIAFMIWLERRFKLAAAPRILAINLLAIIGFWALVNLFAGQWLPAVIGTGLIVLLLKLRNGVTLKR